MQSEVRTLLDSAQQYSDTVLTPFRTDATAYYLGKPLGTEMEGRSSFVMTELYDTVQAILPSLMRVFFAGERVVEFRPRSIEDVPACEQATDYVNYLVTEENDGFRTCYAAFKDALIRKLGIVKYWWEDGDPILDTYDLTGLSPDQLTLLNADPDIVEGEVTAQHPDGTVDIRVTRSRQGEGRCCIEAVPPEEYLFSPTARNQKDAPLVAHKTTKRPHELRQMGYPAELVERASKANTDTLEEQARKPDNVTQGDGDDDRVDYAECFVYLDEDGDGIAEHRRIVLIGNEVADDQPFVGRPFALFQMDPEPHTMIGRCVSDGTMDLQRLNSALVRGFVDNMGLVINPRMGVVTGQVEMADVLNTEIGAVIRMNAPGMVQPYETPFVGDKIIAALAMTGEVKENRFGISKAAAGLNPDALQSSTKAAVAATVTASQQHLELLARLFAEGMKDLYKGVLRLVVQYQDRPKVVRLRNTYAEVDPRPWNADMDATVNVALGVGLTEEKIAALNGIKQAQEGLLQILGPNNPVVTLGQYVHTLSQMASLAGFKDTTQFFMPLPRDFQLPQQPPKPTPEEIYAQVEQTKVEASIAVDAAKLDLDRRKALLEEERKRDELHATMFLEAMKLGAANQAQEAANEVKRIIAEKRVSASDVGLNQ